MKVTVKANAKINLFLDILSKNIDGYHNVDMIMQSISLQDTIDIRTTLDRKITLQSEYCFDVKNEDNTVCKAANLFFQRFNIENPGIVITIQKRIPVYAGLAGGSADAAATLIGLKELFLNTNESHESLLEVASKIGSDVPFCVIGGTQIATGTGVKLSSIEKLPNCYIVLVKPEISVSTGYAYTESDKFGPRGSGKIKNMISSIKCQSLIKICSQLYNRFEEVLDLPEINKIKYQMISNGALGAAMSGSGPTVYGIFESKPKAEKCRDVFLKKYSQTFLCVPENAGCILIKNKE